MAAADTAEEPPQRSLDGPRDNTELYDARGEDVSDLRPVCQGDVFEGLSLPGYDGDDHSLVMLSQHPCSLREGAALRPRVQAAPVRPYQRVRPNGWSGHGKVFPLPEFDGTRHLAAFLSEAGMITADQLEGARRVATLSDQAVLLLQQRIVWTAAHTIIKLDTFEEFNAPALAELELLEDWNELLCGELTGTERSEALARTAQEFETFVRDSGLQQQLANAPSRGNARSQIRQEGRRRAERPHPPTALQT